MNLPWFQTYLGSHRSWHFRGASRSTDGNSVSVRCSLHSKLLKNSMVVCHAKILSFVSCAANNLTKSLTLPISKLWKVHVYPVQNLRSTQTYQRLMRNHFGQAFILYIDALVMLNIFQ